MVIRNPAWAIIYGGNFDQTLYLHPYNPVLNETFGKRVVKHSYPYGKGRVHVSSHEAGRQFNFSAIILDDDFDNAMAEKLAIETAVAGFFHFHHVTHQLYENCQLLGPDSIQFDMTKAIKGIIRYSIAFDTSNTTFETVTAIGASPFDNLDAVSTGVNDVNTNIGSVPGVFLGEVENTVAGDEFTMTMPGDGAVTWSIDQITITNSVTDPDATSGQVTVRVADYGVGGSGASMSHSALYNEKTGSTAAPFTITGGSTLYVWINAATDGRQDVQFRVDFSK